MNHTQIPNQILESLVSSSLSAQELRVVLFVARKTYGWGKQEDAISYSQFTNHTGIGRRSVARVITKLVTSGALVSHTALGKTSVYSIPDLASGTHSTSDVDHTSVMQHTKLVLPMTPTIEKNKAAIAVETNLENKPTSKVEPTKHTSLKDSPRPTVPAGRPAGVTLIRWLTAYEIAKSRTDIKNPKSPLLLAKIAREDFGDLPDSMLIELRRKNVKHTTN